MKNKGTFNPILGDFTWRCDLPALLKEIQSCSGIGIYYPALRILAGILACVAKRALELDDPVLNICMLKLKLYDVNHYDIENLIKEQLKRLDKNDET